MPALDGAVVVPGLLVPVGIGLLLYWAVRGEADRGERMSRAEAARVARRDTDEGGRRPR